MTDFASTSINVVLHAEKLFNVDGVSITNSMLLGWLVSFLLVVVFIFAARKVKITSSKGSASLIEIICEAITNLTDQVMHDRKKAVKYAPFLITLFCFILFNNWFGLLPGVGSITYHGSPLFRAWTSDLTGTLALSISSIVIIQVYTIRELKIRGHIQHYFSDKPWNPINLFVGLLEVLGEFTRVASLALRLFGNIFAGEVLLLVLSAITGFLSPLATLPFIFMELFVGFIQAFVFTMLVIVYLTLATASHDEDHEEVSDHSAQANQAAQPAVSPSGG
jgi:F-type H+-transporting ATPase subunit a